MPVLWRNEGLDFSVGKMMVKDRKKWQITAELPGITAPDEEN